MTTYTCSICSVKFEASVPRDGKPEEAKLLWDEDDERNVAIVCPHCFEECLILDAWKRAGHLGERWFN